MALTETSVYAATGQGTGLAKWERVPLPSGLTSEALLGAHIFVVKEGRGGGEVLYLFTRTGSAYQLGKEMP